ncbi:MAG: YARHG domain-containing protein [Lachnospiraceae bacterium]|nr:YARHG domain-containing protein [Lachnospiraceae bacterium]
MKKSIFWGSMVLITALLAGCQGNSAQAEAGRPAREAAAAQEVGETAEEQAPEEKAEPVDPESLAAELEGERIADLSGDFDHDDLADLAVCTRGGDGTVTLWLLSGDGRTVKVSESGREMAELGISPTDAGNHLIFNTYNSAGSSTAFEIWELGFEEPVLMAEGSGNAYSEEGKLRVVVEDYDGMFMQDAGLAVHTWKNAYLGFEDMDYVEYGAVQLSEEEFLALGNAGRIRDILKNEEKEQGAAATSFAYFYRANDIVEIQTFSQMESGDRYFRITTLPCEGDSLDLEKRVTGDGLVRESYTSLPKEYPARGAAGGDVSRERLEGSFYARLMEQGQVFPESSEKKLTWEDLEKLSHDPVEEKDKLFRLAVNEIYARHGYIFSKVKWFSDFYKQFEWYKPSVSDASAVDTKLTAAEKENLKLLTDMESGSRWNPADGAALREEQREDLLDLMTGTQRKEHLTGSDGYNDYDLTYEVPFIRMDSYDARTYNAMLRREIYPYIDDAKAALDQGYSPWLYGVDYKAYVWKNTLTVLTWVRGDWGINIYYPITLDLDTGKKLSNEETGALYGMDPQEMKTAVREAMRAYYEKAFSGARENAESFYRSQLEKTAASSNTDKAILYPTADGTPYLVCTIYSLAGADSYDYCIPLQ